MKSISFRNFIATALMLAVCLLLVAASVVGIGQGYVIDEYKDNMENSAGEVARTAYAMAVEESLSSWRLAMTISSVSKATGNHIFITDSEGVIVNCCDAAPVCDHQGEIIPKEIIGALSSSGSFRDSTVLGGLFETKRLVSAVAVKGEDEEEQPIGFVFASVNEHDIVSGWRSFFFFVLLVSIVVFFAMLIFAFRYSKHMSRPLDEIAAASRMFARGDFSVRVKQQEDTTDEMGALIDSFNKMADSLENAEKRRSEFISNISHELRTPMTTISGFADGILDGTIPKEEETRYLISIRDETRRLARLVRNMLDASRMHSMASDKSRRTVFDITELVLQTLLSFESRATAKNLDVDPQLPENGILVRADRDGITQVIYNLLDNAIKFSFDGSCITVRINKDTEKAYVSIKDCGETIPPEDLPYIFDRFHKSDRSRSMDKDGVGLGLYLVKTIVNAHDEDIAVKSENGMTEFVFTLPLAE